MAGLIMPRARFSASSSWLTSFIWEESEWPDASRGSQVPVVNTICLLSSSVTITFAVRALGCGRNLSFGAWWFVTRALGGFFLFGTGREWLRLIYEKGLTIGTNLFGTTSTRWWVLHASHVVVGLVALLVVIGSDGLWSCPSVPCKTHRGCGHLLAFRGCHLGCGIHRGLYHRALEKAG